MDLWNEAGSVILQYNSDLLWSIGVALQPNCILTRHYANTAISDVFAWDVMYLYVYNIINVVIIFIIVIIVCERNKSVCLYEATFETRRPEVVSSVAFKYPAPGTPRSTLVRIPELPGSESLYRKVARNDRMFICVHIQWRLWHLRRRPGPVSRAVSQSPWVSQPEVTHYISSSCHAPLSVYQDRADMSTYCVGLIYRWLKEDLQFWYCGIYSQHRWDFANNALKK